MKAILVVDMPNDCWECPMHIDGLDDENEEIMVCNAKVRESHYGEKPSWCPLRPLPQKYDEAQMREQKGWNRCLDAITGGEE